jgi:hypothetical protein
MNALSLARFGASLLFTVATLALSACATTAPREKVMPDRVQVAWAPTEKLSEVRDHPQWRGWLKPDEWQRMLSEHLRKRADVVLPPGERLEVTIDDIKLAGDYEPWRGPNLEDVRIMKDIYPPRLDLHYRLLGADGAPIRSGENKLRDMGYLQRTLPSSNDPLRYDKRQIDEWLRKEFGPPRG